MVKSTFSKKVEGKDNFLALFFFFPEIVLPIASTPVNNFQRGNVITKRVLL